MKQLTPILASMIIGATVTNGAVAEDRPLKSFEYPFPEFGSVERVEPELDTLIDKDASMYKLAEGFNWAEGPAWDFVNGKLLFSDVPENIVFQWSRDEGASIFLSPSGFTGEFYNGFEPGSNGLAFDLDGMLVLCQHGDRRVARLNTGRRGYSTVVGKWEGKRFNSPNDLCFDNDGNMYFTDPPYGMAPSTKREISHHGVYRLSATGDVSLVSTELERPNGIAISPDNKTLYVANSHGPRPIIMAFSIRDDGSLDEGTVFFDSSELRAKGRRGGNDGLKTDMQGNVWATAPGGVIVLDPNGKLLGSLLTGRPTANCGFGDADAMTLYITADDVLCRIRTNVKGYFPSPN